MKTSFTCTVFFAIVALACSVQAQQLSAEGECSLTACINPFQGTVSGVVCSVSKKYINCLKEKVLNNDACGWAKKLAGKGMIKAAEIAMKAANCKTDLTAVASCDINVCTYPQSNSSSFCQQAREYGSCIQENVFDVEHCHHEQKEAGHYLTVALSTDIAEHKCADILQSTPMLGDSYLMCMARCVF
ncbi:uncharacterized protein LOC131943078 [Physella acuta]|uniref:uncharacterized protein LOC131943078 n=1 Tax=Physella acuta TaxID=109671 RepID=UPI0027DDD469|nr:uncharacterized protein LOC131943078 [Physella acuta]